MSFNLKEGVDELLARLKQDGVSVATVEDGNVFMISTQTLQSLLEQSRETGVAILFVKKHVPSGNAA